MSLLPGIFLSNFGLSINGIGGFGTGGTSDAARTGSMMWTVTNTINSLLLLFMDLDRKNWPKTGMSPNPGTLLIRTVAR